MSRQTPIISVDINDSGITMNLLFMVYTLVILVNSCRSSVTGILLKLLLLKLITVQIYHTDPKKCYHLNMQDNINVCIIIQSAIVSVSLPEPAILLHITDEECIIVTKIHLE